MLPNNIVPVRVKYDLNVATSKRRYGQTIGLPSPGADVESIEGTCSVPRHM